MPNSILATKPPAQKDQLIKEFLNQYRSPGTRRQYTIALDQFFKFAGEKPFTAYATQDITNYQASIKQSSTSTVAWKTNALKKFFNYLFQRKILPEDIGQFVLAPKVYNHYPDVLSEQESQVLIKMPDKRTLIGKRDYAILCLMLSTGLRIEEITRINRDDFRTKYNSLMLKITGKGEKPREVKILPHIHEAIKDYIKALKIPNAPDMPLFSTISRRGIPSSKITQCAIRYLVKKYIRKALITDKKITPHSLRHTCFSLEAQSGANIREIQEQAGHSSITTTQRYLHTLGARAEDKNPLFKNPDPFL